MNTGFEGIGSEDIESDSAQPAIFRRSSLNRYQLFSPTTTDMIYNLSHHVLLIDKTCSIN